MNQQVFIVLSYLHHRMMVQSKYKIHSPFVYEFYKQVLTDNNPYSQYRVVNRMRKELETVSRFIKRKDHGANCRDFPSDQRFVRVGDIARRTAVSRKKGELLYRIARWIKPQYILELGTSLGISSMYLAMAIPDGKLVTLEGCIDSAKIARENFEKVGQKNIMLITGEFSATIPDALNMMPYPGMVFFDGNHRRDSTVDYFRQCLQHVHPDTVFIFDDIHWSVGMEEAWQEIMKDGQTRVCIDLFQMGIVFFREELSKENYILRF